MFSDFTDPATLKGLARHAVGGLGAFLVGRGTVSAEQAAAITEHLPTIVAGAVALFGAFGASVSAAEKREARRARRAARGL